jgi:molybdate transport system ATP-binding protein
MADQLSVEIDAKVDFGVFGLDVAVEARPGSTVALTGPNGAGKTTLLRALAGVQPIDSGRIAIGEVVVDEPTTGTWVHPERRGVGFVFQDHRLFPSMSAAENIAFGPRASGLGRAAARESAAKWLATVGLTDHGSTEALDLSGGQAQRVALARALATEPRLLLLDEPFASVDEANRQAMLEVLAALEVTTFVATHDQQIVEILADKEIEMELGRVV